ncbi:ABC transporter substrate-binding protein [Thermodesulfobacteriota bacterium]
MKTSIVRKMVFIVVPLMLLAIPCAKAVSQEAPRYGGVLITGMPRPLKHFDIHSHSTTMGMSIPIFPAYNTLVETDRQDSSKIVGDLAESWEMIDNVTYIFHLHKGVKFHDGVELTSEDVKFSLDRIRLPLVTPSRRKSYLASIDKIEAPDKYTVKITTKYPSAGFLKTLCPLWMAIMPKHIIEEKGDMKKTVIGTGPFKFKSYKPDVGIVLVRNENYFKKGLPYLDEYRTLVIPDPGTLLEAFTQRKIHLSGYPWETDEELNRIKKAMPGVKLFPTRRIGGPTMVFNVRRPPFDDIRVRRAIDLAIDRQGIAKMHAIGGQTVLCSPMHDTEWALPYEELEKRPGLREDKTKDIAEAKRLLAQAGYGPQNPLTFDIMIGQAKALARIHNTDDWAVNIKEQLKNSLGVQANLKSVAYPAPFRDNCKAGKFDSFLLIYSMPSDDPDALRAVWMPGASLNYSGFKDTEIANMLKKQSSIMDKKERRKLVWEMQRKIMDTHAATYVFGRIMVMALTPDVMGYNPDYGRVYERKIKNLEGAWLKK